MECSPTHPGCNPTSALPSHSPPPPCTALPFSKRVATEVSQAPCHVQRREIVQGVRCVCAHRGNRFWKEPERLSQALRGGMGKEGRGHFLGEVGMRQLQTRQQSGVSCVLH